MDALTKMSDTYRDVLIMRYVHGVTVKEISSVLGLSCETVKTKLKRGKAILRSILKNEGNRHEN